MKLPNKIYLQWYEDEPTWNNERITDEDIEYIRAPQWISVEDRLPDQYLHILVYCNRAKNSNTWAEIHIAYLSQDGWHLPFRSDYELLTKITHWMPLPEPPEVE